MHRVLFSSSLVAVLVASSGLYACSGPASSGDTPPPSTASEPAASASEGEPSRTPGHAIATIVTQNARVTIMAGGSDDLCSKSPSGCRPPSAGLRFVVRKTNGALVADGVTADTLRTIDPTLHAIVTNAFAGGGGAFDPTKPYLDATL
jgi:hypothetical protein